MDADENRYAIIRIGPNGALVWVEWVKGEDHERLRAIRAGDPQGEYVLYDVLLGEKIRPPLTGAW